jgi:hypothetical protein
MRNRLLFKVIISIKNNPHLNLIKILMKFVIGLELKKIFAFN